MTLREWICRIHRHFYGEMYAGGKTWECRLCHRKWTVGWAKKEAGTRVSDAATVVRYAAKHGLVRDTDSEAVLSRLP